MQVSISIFLDESWCTTYGDNKESCFHGFPSSPLSSDLQGNSVKAPVVKNVSVEKSDVTEFNRILCNCRRVTSVSFANDSIAQRTSNWLCGLKA